MVEEILKVMIVDDDGAIRQSFGDYFEDYGFQPLPVESGEAALELLGSLTPDIAIVDIRLGGMSGDEFIRQAHQRQPYCLFIICTGSPAYEIPASLSELNQVSPRIFQKPVADLNLLQQEIKRMLTWIHPVNGEVGDA